MIVRSLREVSTSTVPTRELPRVRIPTTDKHVAIKPALPCVRLVYHRFPADLSYKEEGAVRLHEEIRLAVGAYGDILHMHPVAISLSDGRYTQMERFGFRAYFVRSGQGFRAIPLRRGALPDGMIVCTSA